MLNTTLDFGKQAECARRGLDAAKRLLALYIKLQVRKRDCVRKPPNGKWP
jgi:hypothetical protein